MRAILAIVAVLVAWFGALPARPGRAEPPADLEACLVALDRVLSPEVIAKMRDGAEDDMVLYHHGLGTHLRNEWGLWRGSALGAYFNTLGIEHPDDMSGIILTSYWRRLHRQPLDVEGQVAHYRRYWEGARQAQAAEDLRAEGVSASLSQLMMGLTVAGDAAPTAALPMQTQSDDSVRARRLFAYGGGVIVAAREENEDESYFIRPHFLDTRTLLLRPIQVAGLDDVTSTVVVGHSAYFLGHDESRLKLVAVNGRHRNDVPLPPVVGRAQLGMDDNHLLLVFPRSIYRRDAGGWKLIHESTVDLPWSGPPPRKSGRHVYFRDEGRHEDDKRLWQLDIEKAGPPVSLDRACGLVGPSGPRWENASSYVLTADGQLWAALGGGVSAYSVIRRGQDGRYHIALMNGEVTFDGKLLRSIDDGGIQISALSIGPDGVLMGAGGTGLYRIEATRLERLVAFSNTAQKIPREGTSVYHWLWQPTDLLPLNGDRYLISGMYGGIYVLERGNNRPYTLRCVDCVMGQPIAF